MFNIATDGDASMQQQATTAAALLQEQEDRKTALRIGAAEMAAAGLLKVQHAAAPAEIAQHKTRRSRRIAEHETEVASSSADVLLPSDEPPSASTDQHIKEKT